MNNFYLIHLFPPKNEIDEPVPLGVAVLGPAAGDRSYQVLGAAAQRQARIRALRPPVVYVFHCLSLTQGSVLKIIHLDCDYSIPHRCTRPMAVETRSVERLLLQRRY